MFATRILSGLLCLGLLTANARADLSFAAESIDGQSANLEVSKTDDLSVVCFLGTECPLAVLYGPRLNSMADRFGDRDVRFYGIMSNSQDTLDQVRDYVANTGIDFPVIHDPDQTIADRFEATRTPEVFLLNRNLEILYRGRIDDQYDPGVVRSAPERDDLQLAITETLAGQPVSVRETEPAGCLIGRQASQPGDASGDRVTYYRDVLPVLQQNCIECHRPGQIAPFSMNSYRRVSGWADTMLETIEDGRMPPWSADPHVGEFVNARNLSERDRQILFDWVAGGKLAGDPADAPEPVKFTDGWQLGREPDLILPMRDRPFAVPREGTVEYQYFIVDPGFEQERWIRGAEIIPGNRSVVHHVIVFIRPPDGETFRGAGLLTGYVPGQRIMLPPEGYGRRVPAGSKLVFQVHYTPNGRAADDLSRIGIVFADAENITHEMYSLISLEQEFEIPPHEKQYRVTSRIRRLPTQGELLSVAPHMHYRGKSFEVVADANGQQRPLLRVPYYDFNWQHSYIFATPLPLADLKSLQFTATFDNSAENPFNPDPSQWVTWGDQTWEEMAVAFYEIAVPVEREPSGQNRKVTSSDEIDPVTREKINRYIDHCFAQMDSNGDGVIKLKEAPLTAQFRWFRRVDLNRDRIVTRDELASLGKTLVR